MNSQVPLIDDGRTAAGTAASTSSVMSVGSAQDMSLKIGSITLDFETVMLVLFAVQASLQAITLIVGLVR